MNNVTFEMLKIVVALCAALVTAYLVPYIESLKQDKRYAALLEIIDVAVRAAEQVIGEGKGKLKKSEVMSFVREWIEGKGIKITDAELDQLIECAVFEMKEGF
jgi:LL-H family phage holin